MDDKTTPNGPQEKDKMCRRASERDRQRGDPSREQWSKGHTGREDKQSS